MVTHKTEYVDKKHVRHNGVLCDIVGETGDTCYVAFPLYDGTFEVIGFPRRCLGRLGFVLGEIVIINLPGSRLQGVIESFVSKSRVKVRCLLAPTFRNPFPVRVFTVSLSQIEKIKEHNEETC